MSDFTYQRVGLRLPELILLQKAESQTYTKKSTVIAIDNPACSATATTSSIFDVLTSVPLSMGYLLEFSLSLMPQLNFTAFYSAALKMA